MSESLLTEYVGRVIDKYQAGDEVGFSCLLNASLVAPLYALL